MANRVQEITSKLKVQEGIQSPTSVSSPETIVFTKPSRLSSVSFDPGGGLNGYGHTVSCSGFTLNPPSCVLVSFPLNDDLIVRLRFENLLFATLTQHRIHIFDPGGIRDVDNSTVVLFAFSSDVGYQCEPDPSTHARNAPSSPWWMCTSFSWEQTPKRAAPSTSHGTIDTFGVIKPDDGGDEFFVHQSSIRSEGFRSLQEGNRVVLVIVFSGLLVCVLGKEEEETKATGNTREEGKNEGQLDWAWVDHVFQLMGFFGARSRIEELPSNTTNGTPSFSYTSFDLMKCYLLTYTFKEPNWSVWNDTMGQTPACSVNLKQPTQGISILAQTYDGCPKAHGLFGETHFKEMNTVTTSRLEDKSSFQGVGSVRPLISGIILVEVVIGG